MAKKIKKILIANRGEIAVRVIKTCREMGIKTVTIYSEDDKHLLHVLEADESYSLGSGLLRETYLNQNKIVEIAKLAKADAIHPGYGFLSENATFCTLVEKHNIIFIGPTTNAMNLMGDKKRSKECVEEIKGPLIPGYHGNNSDFNFLKKKAVEIGFPLLIKASAGGGGKGMRIVNKIDEFEHELNGAKREAKNAFGDDTVLLEKYLTNPRHIEVQVMSDQHGNHFHFYERECSIQRRHQKIVEEAPAVNLPIEIKNRMFSEALKICKKINYRGAGTMEFIYDDDLNEFYFLEMNTRLQVEHPITELTTGFDLVKLQILVAEGIDLSKVLKQEDIKQKGHAIEVRIYAEDPDNEFLPTIGEIHHIGTPSLNNVRLDCGYVNGNVVGLNYDPMLAKLITYGTNRIDAINKLIFSLNEVIFAGVKNNRDYLQRILNLDEFKQGKITTQFVIKYKEKLKKKVLNEEEVAKILAGFLLFKNKKHRTLKSKNENVHTNDPWTQLTNFRNN